MYLKVKCKKMDVPYLPGLAVQRLLFLLLFIVLGRLVFP